MNVSHPWRREQGADSTRLRDGELDAEHSDVVFLAEGEDVVHDGGGGLIADVAGAVEAEEFFGRVGGFDDAIGDEGEVVAGVEGDGLGGVVDVVGDSEGEGAFEFDLFAIAVGGDVAGVGHTHDAGGGDFGGEAGGEVATGAAHHTAVERGEHEGWVRGCVRPGYGWRRRGRRRALQR